jgi:hypothetical protein
MERAPPKEATVTEQQPETEETSGPNEYLPKIRRHWQTFLPKATAALPDPEKHFLDLSQRVEAMVNDATDDLLAKETLPADPQERAQLIDALRRRAEEVTLANEVYLPPEPGAENNELPR